MKRILKWSTLVLGILLLILLVGPFLIPVPPLQNTVPPRQLADDDSQFVTLRGLEVHYKATGQGEPTMLLLHGFGASVFSWHQVIDPLAEWGTVIAYDRPAFGLTERPLPEKREGENPYSAAFQVQMVIDLMDTLGVQRAILIGNSAGGTISALAALAHPDRVQALVLVDPAIYTQNRSSALFRLLVNTPQMRHLGPLFARRIQASGQDFLRSAWHDPTRITAETWQGYQKPLQTENWDRALWEFTAASRPTALAEQLTEIAVPTLVITGDDDRIVPTEQSIRAAGEIPGAQLVVVPECGHVPHEECPVLFLDAVQDFVQQTISITNPD